MLHFFPVVMLGIMLCFVGNQFPYLVIWFPFVFGRNDDDVMTMLPRICRSTVTAAIWTAAHTLSWFVSFVTDGISMKLTLLPVNLDMNVSYASLNATSPTVFPR